MGEHAPWLIAIKNISTMTSRARIIYDFAYVQGRAKQLPVWKIEHCLEGGVYVQVQSSRCAISTPHPSNFFQVANAPISTTNPISFLRGAPYFSQLTIALQMNNLPRRWAYVPTHLPTPQKWRYCGDNSRLAHRFPIRSARASI